MSESMSVTIHFKDDATPKTFRCSHCVFLDPIGNWLALLNEHDDPFISFPKATISFVEYVYDEKESTEVKH